MTTEDVVSAIGEAKRFIKAAENLLKRRKDTPEFYSTREGGACRRASLDLTMKLAEMRRAGR